MAEREVVVTKREIAARIVPAGTEISIPKDTFVTITQSLGGTFTVSVNGNLARIEGRDADALGKTVVYEEVAAPEDGSVSEEQVWAALNQVYDPEIPVSVVELGLIYNCKVKQNEQDASKYDVFITMTLTAPGCGMGPVIVDDVRHYVARVPNVSRVEVDLVFDPPWNNDMLSDEAKLELGLL
ncbi:putative Fe-S cluster assembly protein SufT [Oleiphilus sp. HI0071]|jgi:probable FeS assembly SUF system protein SufT|nr:MULTISPECIES: putative Fe-S cluster assembly protein SufT [unclassified Oleiphilus]KZY67213.1 putative Fe-S cluster assembly protein SufT [Oleiphilus sp. HI0065]KZY78969.1 putative Fe-S cluster assembly protein SufT [Oleiphilus sp. HI0071]KZY91912.1 putative Fe-S cluster assembly protein SufT [Oleiphilus sp. HI0073]KZZ57901.1 putative Fe-S cluster assembly protein SufT [Oleiphilus sp. HI0122]KZZ66986.1 putative Fe-S cluster assembly protein SufT [Oleiphilus sp. HI0130]KZZ80632.1 putative F